MKITDKQIERTADALVFVMPGASEVDLLNGARWHLERMRDQRRRIKVDLFNKQAEKLRMFKMGLNYRKGGK